MKTETEIKEVVIKFAGDSGDGMQLAGNQFSFNSALAHYDIATLNDFPAEIRAPQGSLFGVSGFQLHFGGTHIETPGDELDVLVVMNASAFKKNIQLLKKGGVLIANTSGFDAKNLKLAAYEHSPLSTAGNYRLIELDINKQVKEILHDQPVDAKEKLQCRNMYVLGFLYWLYNREPESTEKFLKEKLVKKPDLLNANLAVLAKGYHLAETMELGDVVQQNIKPASYAPGLYRSITGNGAVALGLMAASAKAGLQLFYGSYPITPASDILHQLSRHKDFGVITFQAEDEIGAAAAAVGASFGGLLAACATSGPGMLLKAETINLAVMAELPLVVIDVQRAGPSTGMPTKTEQTDLLMAMYGRSGESPLPVFAAHSAASAFEMTYLACKVALERMTPVVLLCDAYLANGAELWKIPDFESLPSIAVAVDAKNEERHFPYKRDEKLVRNWAWPGMKNKQHRIGGLEKSEPEGNISYDAQNHELMVKTRERKIALIADDLPEQKLLAESSEAQILVIAWGSTKGAVSTAVKKLASDNCTLAYLHLDYINPFPKNLGSIISCYKKILIPELNSGQLIKVLRSTYSAHFVGYHKIQGTPFTVDELSHFFKSELQKVNNE